MLLVLSGCASPSDPNSQNFKEAVGDYLGDSRCLLREVPYGSFLLNKKVNKSGVHVLQSDHNMDRFREVLESAVEIELMDKSSSEIDDPAGSGKSWVTTFTPTDAGEHILSLIGEGRFIQICYGRVSLGEILSFSEPSDFFGYRVTDVRYSYTIEKVIEWVKQPEVTNWISSSGGVATETGRQLEADLSGKVQRDRLRLYLTSEGWSANHPSEP